MYDDIGDIKVGDKLEIHCYKHNGHLFLSEGILIC